MTSDDTSYQNQSLCFDVLLRGESEKTDVVTAANLDKARPTAETVERCFRWLSNQGVTCHKAGFSLACTSTVEIFERLFSVKVAKTADHPPAFELPSEPVIPAEIESLVAQVTLVRPPTLFG